MIQDILEALRRIEEYRQGVTYEAFLRDTKLQDAIVRNLGIIGEAVKNLSPAFKKQHNMIEWKKIAGLRDRVIHHYFGVNWDIVWDVVVNKVPEMRTQFQAFVPKNSS